MLLGGAEILGEEAWGCLLMTALSISWASRDLLILRAVAGSVLQILIALVLRFLEDSDEHIFPWFDVSHHSLLRVCRT